MARTLFQPPHTTLSVKKHSIPDKARKVGKTILGMAVWGALLVIPVLVLAGAIYMITAVSLGLNPSSILPPRNQAQIDFWMIIWGVLVALATFLFLRKKHLFSSLRLLILICLPFWVIFWIVAAHAALGQAQDAETASSTCNLSTTLNNAFGATYPVRTDSGSGTAFAIDGDGTLVTAYHVIEGASAITMSSLNGEVPLSVIKTSPKHDLALLRYPKPTPAFLPLVTNPAVADEVYALGYPGNAFSAGNPTVSAGIVSRLIDSSYVHMSYSSAPQDLTYIQTDAAINPGNSGGALINKCGAVGVVDAISDSEGMHNYNLPVSEQNISYAISAQTVKSTFGL